MVTMILISHGQMCEGLLDTLKMVGGDDFGIQTLPLLPGVTPENYRESLHQILLSVTKKDDEVLVLTDIAGGTPYQSALYLARDFKMKVIAGMNLPVVLTLALEQSCGASLSDLVKKAQNPETLGFKIETFETKRRDRHAKLSVNED
ncbi:PTS sugar transporter subunit IIA [Lacticaseibacillus paracasei]|uniref:PTS sugar transporter subunit IIA n=2 Tax=Lacticaseibacillus paracasei TaxID=1597 RepID=A0AAW6A216_LACPA|nr:PTS sugar transporter subunit IIA [Lacticaseibacillus paracasei]MDB1563886.1 PTS sugar transporter subunit IIA [Lacticaseibacillus paracasei]